MDRKSDRMTRRRQGWGRAEGGGRRPGERRGRTEQEGRREDSITSPLAGKERPRSTLLTPKDLLTANTPGAFHVTRQHPTLLSDIAPGKRGSTS